MGSTSVLSEWQTERVRTARAANQLQPLPSNPGGRKFIDPPRYIGTIGVRLNDDNKGRAGLRPIERATRPTPELHRDEAVTRGTKRHQPQECEYVDGAQIRVEG